MSRFERLHCLIFSTSVIFQLITLGFQFHQFRQPDPPSTPVVVVERPQQL